MLDTISKAEPSELPRANPLLMKELQTGRLSLSEAERRASGPERLKEAFSSIPFHAQRAAKDPDYWKDLYGSRAAW